MNSLIILDWDDTLFPTSWVVKNGIDLTDKQTKNKYIVYFSQLDNILYKLLNSFMEHGNVYIVTNAKVKWVLISADILPNTKKLLNNKIKVLSAREKHEKEFPNDMFAWKRMIFKNVVSEVYSSNDLQNIISIGDADYEYKALVNLWNKKKNNRILKTVKFVSSPTFDSLIDQLDVLSTSVNQICLCKKHMDLKFNNLFSTIQV